MEELVYGSPAHRPMSASELVSWLAYDEIVREERERAEREARG